MANDAAVKAMPWPKIRHITFAIIVCVNKSKYMVMTREWREAHEQELYVKLAFQLNSNCSIYNAQRNFNNNTLLDSNENELDSITDCCWYGNDFQT